MRRQTWRTPDVTATLRPMVRNAPSGDRSPPAWRRGTKFFKQNYPDHECSALLAGVIFEKYILVFQIQIFGTKYKIQEGYAWPRRLQGEQRPNYAARKHETRHRAF